MPPRDADRIDDGMPSDRGSPRIRWALRRAAPWLVGLTLVFGLPALFPGLVRRAAPLLLYHPVSLSAERSAPAAWGLSSAEEITLRPAGEPALHGWWVPARSNRRCATVLFLHGNAGNVAGRAPMAGDLARRGLDVMLVDYRGYGRSEGSPSEEGLYRDAESAYRYLREERGVRARELVIAGHSLGGAVAAHLAAGRPAAAVILTATFTSLSDAARAVYPWLPARWFDWDPVPFPTLRRVADFEAPVLVGRGGADRLIPRDQVRALFQAAPEPRSWVEVPDADHGGLWHHPSFQVSVRGFLGRHVTGCAHESEPGTTGR